MRVELREAALAELPVMQRMGRYYVYDMSEYVGGQPGWEFPDSGDYECDDFRPYFDDPQAKPFFIRADGELAGFAIVDRRGSTPEVDFNMAQFFVIRKFKRRGVGADAAAECFNRFRGVWDVMVISENVGAHAFWEKTIDRFTDGQFQEIRRSVAHLGNSEQDVFRFQT
ncbi:MAG TPA: GNAT family N-acetyltransferase [Caulobacteraceae bacterium]|jgi:predicted acetyltransferase